MKLLSAIWAKIFIFVQSDDTGLHLLPAAAPEEEHPGQGAAGEGRIGHREPLPRRQGSFTKVL